jgi:8-hydroxy-5-deazaflavin:NADPH oxidoreductase
MARAMRIGIIGSGELGGALADLLVQAGHQVAIGDPRGPESLKELADTIGITGMTVEDAARFGDIVILAAPFRDQEALPPAIAVTGKVVVDAMNPYTESGEVMDLGGKTSSSITAERIPGAVLVKAFNTMEAGMLRSEARRSVPKEQRLVIFLAGDSVRAKARVGTLIQEIGFTPIDTGSLARGGRIQEPGSKIFGRPLLPAEARRLVALS